MAYLLTGVLMLFASLWLAHAFARADTRWLAGWTRTFAGWLLLALAMLLLTRGVVFIAVPLGFFAISLLGWRLPLPSVFDGLGGPRKSSGKNSSGKASTVRTAMLEMRLDHDTGRMQGRVLKGRFAGRVLEELSLEDLMALWRDCRIRDPQGALLLETLLERAAPGWRDGLAGDGRRPSPPPADGRMTVEEAHEVLGLKPDASRAEIISAHRSLMKRFHPDQGGSNYLAVKINEAKDVLLASEHWRNYDDT
jgi:hypothetical protein